MKESNISKHLGGHVALEYDAAQAFCNVIWLIAQAIEDGKMGNHFIDEMNDDLLRRRTRKLVQLHLPADFWDVEE